MKYSDRDIFCVLEYAVAKGIQHNSSNTYLYGEALKNLFEKLEDDIQTPYAFLENKLAWKFSSEEKLKNSNLYKFYLVANLSENLTSIDGISDIEEEVRKLLSLEFSETALLNDYTDKKTNPVFNLDP